MKPLLSRICTCLLLLTGLNQLCITAQAQCNAPALTFHSPVLLSGTDGQIGAIYKFADVLPGVDAHIEITDLYGGATLNNIDDSAGIGYYDAFQPYVGAGANDTSYLEWRIVFKKSGTTTDTTLECVAVTGVDVDGDGSVLKEFIEAATPGSIGVDPMSNLTVTFDGVRSKAVSPVANIPLIDTFHLEAMFQMNFQNINSLSYRNGAITTGGAQVRQTCIYFRPFFQSYALLSKTLLSFTARRVSERVELKWSAASDPSLRSFIVQRSDDGRTWQNIANVAATSSNDYRLYDDRPLATTSYYRLMEVFINSAGRYSSIMVIPPDDSSPQSFTHNTIFNSSIRVNHISAVTEEFNMAVYTLSGRLLAKRNIMMHPGTNTATLDVPSPVPAGVYLLVIKNMRGQEVHHARLVKSK